jgi:DNA polymerase
MSDAHVFKAGLEVVFQALEQRLVSGSALKAPAAELAALSQSRGAHAESLRASVAVETSKPAPLPSPPPSAVESKPARRIASSPLFAFPMLPSVSGVETPEEALKNLRTKALACNLCESLAATRCHVVFGEGAVHAELMLVSEAPGAEEDGEGRPFAGEAGALLDKMLQAMGLSRDEIYLTSVLKCRPDVPADEAGSRAPTSQELSNCTPYLAAQIALVKPKVIVAMGAGAMRALFGSTETVGKLRSRWHDLQGIPVMPTFHPSYLIRNQSNAEKRKVWEDLLQVMERLGLDISEKQRGFFKPRAGA